MTPYLISIPSFPINVKTYTVVTVHAHACDLIHPILVRIDAYRFGLGHICRNKLDRDQDILMISMKDFVDEQVSLPGVVICSPESSRIEREQKFWMTHMPQSRVIDS